MVWYGMAAKIIVLMIIVLFQTGQHGVSLRADIIEPT